MVFMAYQPSLMSFTLTLLRVLKVQLESQSQKEAGAVCEHG
jgi:hypothetical protein